MKKILSNIWGVMKQIVSEIKVYWKMSKSVTGKGNKLKLYVFIYMITGFLFVYIATFIISIMYILFGIVGGTILGIKESPYWFFLYLMPLFAIPILYFAHFMWTKNYPKYKALYFERNVIRIK